MANYTVKKLNKESEAEAFDVLSSNWMLLKNQNNNLFLEDITFLISELKQLKKTILKKHSYTIEVL